MKKYIFIIIALFACGYSSKGIAPKDKTLTMSVGGNDNNRTTINDSLNLVKTSSPTTEKAKGRTIYLSKNGKKFVVIKSKKGTYYKKYLK